MHSEVLDHGVQKITTTARTHILAAKRLIERRLQRVQMETFLICLSNSSVDRAFNFGESVNGRAQQSTTTTLQPQEPEIGRFTDLCHDLCVQLLRLFALSLKVRRPCDSLSFPLTSPRSIPERVEIIGSRLGMIKLRALQAPFCAFCISACHMWILPTPVR